MTTPTAHITDRHAADPWQRLRWTGFLVVLLLMTWCQMAAASSVPLVRFAIGDGALNRIILPPGTTLTIETDRPFANLVMGNTAVADVVPLNERSLYVQGKSSGSSNIVIYNEQGRVLGVIDVRVQLDFEEVARAIQFAVPSAAVDVTNVNDRIRVSGIVSNAIDLNRVLEIAQAYSNFPVLNEMRLADAQQVLLEVRIIEAARAAGRDLGIGFTGTGSAGIFSISSNVGIGVNDDGNLARTLDPNGTQNGLPFGQLIAQILQTSGIRIDVIINALEAKGLARRLAQPNLIAVSGATASFHAGGEVPITRAVTSGGTIAEEVDYRPYGVRLTFKPTVLDDGLINLVVEPEVSEIDRSLSVNGNPAFISRKAQSTVELRDGQSFALAGLLQTINETDVEQLPWLGQVPVLGTLFRSTSFQKRESDLVIVITPHIVRPAAPGQLLATPLDKSVPGNDVDKFLLGILEVDKDMVQGFKDGAGIVGPYGHVLDFNQGGANAIAKK